MMVEQHKKINRHYRHAVPVMSDVLWLHWWVQYLDLWATSCSPAEERRDLSSHISDICISSPSPSLPQSLFSFPCFVSIKHQKEFCLCKGDVSALLFSWIPSLYQAALRGTLSVRAWKKTKRVLPPRTEAAIFLTVRKQNGTKLLQLKKISPGNRGACHFTVGVRERFC